jgi:nucleotide-binding universal stress UspA family protein
VVVCGVDRSVPARAAARLGAALARRLGFELVLVQAVGAAAQRPAALALLRALRRQLDAPRARLHVSVGPAAEQLAETAQGAALLVVGSGGRGRGVRGSLALRAPCPLAVVPAVPRLGGDDVICAIRDWADVATAGVAARLARGLGLPLTLTHVLPAAVGRREAPATGVLDRPWDHDAALSLLEAVAAAVGGAASLRVLDGTAGRLLAQEAEAAGAALLVVGAPRCGRLEAVLTGSTATYLLSRSRRPLVVCRAQAVPLWPDGSRSS